MFNFVLMEKAYLGVGLKYPTELIGGSVQYVSGLSLVQQSITTILNTPKGTKFLLPEFGSRLRELIFEPNDEVLEDLLGTFIYEAIRDWEKRVEYIKTTFTQHNNVTFCEITYRVLASNEVDSFVYPFYRQLKY